MSYFVVGRTLDSFTLWCIIYCNKAFGESLMGYSIVKNSKLDLYLKEQARKPKRRNSLNVINRRIEEFFVDKGCVKVSTGN